MQAFQRAPGIWVEYMGQTLPQGASLLDVALDEIPDGKIEVSRELVDDGGRPRMRFTTGDAPPPTRRKIRKSIVQDRLIAAGKMDAAKAALDGNAAHFARWFAPDHPEVYADDPDALTLLAAIGADSESIMSAEE